MSKNINFTDVNPINRGDQTMIKNEILNVIKKKDFILGSPVKKFETHFSKLSKIKNTLDLGSLLAMYIENFATFLNMFGALLCYVL